MNGQHPRSPAKLRAEFKNLKAEASAFNYITDDYVVRDWADRFNVFLDQLAFHVGEEDTPDLVVITVGTFQNGLLTHSWVERLKAVVEQARNAVKLLPELPEAAAARQPDQHTARRTSPTGGGFQHHPRVEEIARRFPPAQLGDVAVFEACKDLARRIREMSGLGSDDKRLMERAFSLNDPKIRLNRLDGPTERAEQQGVMQIASGLWLAARNPRAHEPAGTCNPNEIAELLTIVSYLHRRLDAAETSTA